ncbi:hypothetical protein HY484_02210 [Candidatus Woesearchaeota archaeon]|nr:hypothetical protein [Candidatus Woesearchaeota archaeon]
MACYITDMETTTIQVTRELVNALRFKKMYDKESYEDIIWELLEDSKEVNEETKRDIGVGLAEIRAGKTVSLKQIKRKYHLR